MRTIYLSLVTKVKSIVLNETSTQEVTSIMYEGIDIMDRLISTTVIFILMNTINWKKTLKLEVATTILLIDKEVQEASE